MAKQHSGKPVFFPGKPGLQAEKLTDYSHDRHHRRFPVPDFTLSDISERLPADSGGKAHNLRRLLKHGFRVPPARVCPASVCERCFGPRSAGTPLPVETELQAALDTFIGPGRRYAVRSSADREDGSGRSMAGQLRSELDVKGISDVLAAMRRVWSSSSSPDVKSYLSRTGETALDLRTAVIVQDMVIPVISGIAFSRNPLTGLDESVVEAVRGSGERLMGGGITPCRWVYKWGRWLSEPRDTDIDPALILEVIRGVRKAEKTFGIPVDMEWVYDGMELWWVQMRKITTIPEHLEIYSDRISREVLPGLIKPLVWSINVPLVNTAWVRFLTELIGPNDIDPLRLARAFRHRAYFNLGAFASIFRSLGLPPGNARTAHGNRERGA